VLRWHGGKWKLAPFILQYFPEHRIYVEPFGGAGSMLMRKPRVYAEVYNDLDDVVVNLFRVLRDEKKAARLIEALRLTPFARAEFVEALEPAEDDVERARHLIVRSFMGFGSNAHSSSPVADKNGFKSYTRPDEYRSTGFRANSSRSGTTPAHDWANYPEALPAIVERLRGVIVEQRAAIDVMKQHDGGGHAPLRRSALSARDALAGEQVRPEASHVPSRIDGRRSSRIAGLPAHAGRHGGAVRLSERALRRRAPRLAPRHHEGARRWCEGTHRSSLDQSCMRRAARRPAFAADVVRGDRMSIRIQYGALAVRHQGEGG
jgi:hypothetical protein